MRLLGLAAVADERRICGDHGGRRRELRNGDVIGMPVCAVGTERHDHVGTTPAQLAGDGSQSASWGFAQARLLIRVVEQRHPPHAEH